MQAYVYQKGKKRFYLKANAEHVDSLRHSAKLKFSPHAVEFNVSKLLSRG